MLIILHSRIYTTHSCCCTINDCSSLRTSSISPLLHWVEGSCDLAGIQWPLQLIGQSPFHKPVCCQLCSNTSIRSSAESPPFSSPVNSHSWGSPGMNLLTTGPLKQTVCSPPDTLIPSPPHLAPRFLAMYDEWWSDEFDSARIGGLAMQSVWLWPSHFYCSFIEMMIRKQQRNESECSHLLKFSIETDPLKTTTFRRPHCRRSVFNCHCHSTNTIALPSYFWLVSKHTVIAVT